MTATAETPGAATDSPTHSGHFGPYGGRFVPEVLMAALDQLEEAFDAALVDPTFAAELAELERDYTGRPSPLTR
ncbi:MAG: tryptophan synthase subunit beta, partial [Candidatus Nanopelagicales bacterium]